MTGTLADRRLSGARLAVVTNIPTPYRIPLFNELHRQAVAAAAELTVVFAARGYARRQWQIDLGRLGFPFEVLGNAPAIGSDGESAIFSFRRLGRALSRIRPDVVLVAGFSAATVRLWARSWRGQRYVIWSGAITSPYRPVSRLRRLARRLLVRRARGGVAYGTRAKAYLVGLGASPESVRVALNTVDTTFFATASDRARELDPGGGGGRLICVGDLVRRKRADLVLLALAELKRRGREATLTVVGDGPERGRLEELTSGLGLIPQVRFAGFRQKAEIPGFLARSDVFLFPTAFDVWGLVLVEAMAAGLPCLSSPNAGATADLIEDGVTGLRVDFTDRASTADAIEALLDDPQKGRRIGRRARRFVVERLTLERSAAAMLEALAAATASRRGDRR